MIRTVEAVEKVPKQIPGQDAKKSDLIECATINDLMPGKGSSDFRPATLIVVTGFFYGPATLYEYLRQPRFDHRSSPTDICGHSGFNRGSGVVLGALA